MSTIGRHVRPGSMRGTHPSQQKIAERLTILNDRAPGMMTRLFNLKAHLNDPKSKPSFMTERAYQPALTTIQKKFPNIDSKAPSLGILKENHQEILKTLEPYYLTFIDILQFKEHIVDLLKCIDELFMFMDITNNFHVTREYLTLVSNYAKLVILLSRVEDRRLVVGLYSFAHDCHYKFTEASFAHLSEFLAQFQDPVKRLSDEFTRSHLRTLEEALRSLVAPFQRKSAYVEPQWKSQDFLSLLAEHKNFNQIHVSAQDMTLCETLPLEEIETWIYFGFLFCYSRFSQNEHITAMWKRVMSFNFTLTLFRSETINLFKLAEDSLDRQKSAKNLIRDVEKKAQQNVPVVHKERRKYLRQVAREALLILEDEPGLLAPQALLVFELLSYCRDEVLWYVRHSSRENQNKKTPEEQFKDKHIGELICAIVELRALVQKHGRIISKYYAGLMPRFNTFLLQDQLQNLPNLSEEESVLLTSFHQTMSGLSESALLDETSMDQVSRDLRGFRLDWFRFQAYTSVAKATCNLAQQPDFARLMNNFHFHSSLIDDQATLLELTSDLSIFCWHQELFKKIFHETLSTPSMTRYSIAFPMVCSHFYTCRHDLCPEEFSMLRSRSLALGRSFLEKIALEAKKLLVHLYNQKISLADRLYPSQAALILLEMESEQRGEKKKKRRNKNKGATTNNQPGLESHRKDRVRTNVSTPEGKAQQELDLAEFQIAELGAALSVTREIDIFGHIFTPREFIHETLEKQFAKVMVKFIKVDATNQMIEKPSVTLNRLNCFVNTLQGIGVLMDLDIRSIVHNVLLEQTQQNDAAGEKTMTTYYSAWYREVMLRKVTEGVVYSNNQESFVNIDRDMGTKWTAEEYTNTQELRALAELLGPYGIRYILESLSIQIAYQIQELLMTVRKNRTTLRVLRTSFEDPLKMQENTNQLQDQNAFLQRLQLIGVIIEFQSLVQSALETVLENRIPYLLAPIREIHAAATSSQPPHQQPDLEIMLKLTELGCSAGLKADVDVFLCRQLRSKVPNEPNKRFEEYENCCLLLVYTAVAIPFLAKEAESRFDPNFGSHANNTHCIAKAINTITHALFNVHQRKLNDRENDREAEIAGRMVEFLALASSSLLKLGQENGQAAMNRESIYLLLGEIVANSKVLSMDRLESCFPYVLLRNSYADIQEKSRLPTRR